jgi:hypothetical protein
MKRRLEELDKDIRLDRRVDMGTSFVHIMAARFGRRRITALTNVPLLFVMLLLVVRIWSTAPSLYSSSSWLPFVSASQQTFFSNFLVSDFK